MTKKNIKILFYILFAMNAIIGAVAAKVFSLKTGIVAVVFLLAVNIAVYAVVLRIFKIMDEELNGTGKTC